VKAYGKVAYYWSVTPKIVGFFVGRAGYMAPTGAERSLPYMERFRLGGITSIRGFEEESVGPEAIKVGDATVYPGGNATGSYTVEVNFPLVYSLGLAVFTDGGNVWAEKFRLTGANDLRKSSGAGLRYGTPIGPLRLDLGYKLDRRTGETPVAWHFFIGNVF
jgi:outer membrane protein insertion porin family